MMQCPYCQQPTMAPYPTTTGVELDACGQCGSIWFDRGEILFFLRNTQGLSAALGQARTTAALSQFSSPKTGQPLAQTQLPNGTWVCIDRHNLGVWLPGSTVQELKGRRELTVNWQQPRGTHMRFVLPNLVARTIFTLAGLYAVLTAVLIGVSLAGGLSPMWALLIAIAFAGIQFAIGPFLMDLLVRYAYRGQSIAFATMPPALQAFVQHVCHTHQMKTPRFIVIDDMAPNAFTYGHTPNNARIVLTRGMFELLSPQELAGVVGHEMGHARNWDMALMTLAQLVPMVLYFIYRTLTRIHIRDSRARATAAGVAAGAFVLYIVSEYIVLWFSRTREYHADAFGAKAVQSPAALGRALVKVAYGLASRGGGEDSRASKVGAMGIFDVGAAQSLAVTAGGGAGYRSEPAPEAAEQATGYTVNQDALRGAMKWDLWNPWARFYEISSTHPLVAKRLLHLGELSLQIGEEPVVRFDLEQPESLWDEFAVDLMVKVLVGLCLAPWLGAKAIGLALAMMGLASMAKLRFRYPTHDFPDMSVETLMHQIKVSDIRPVPCRLEGVVRGKGVPGLVWSDDFVMQDDTGIIFLDHRQPFSLWEVIWGWLRGDKLIGHHVAVEGWFRRSPMPSVEIKEFTVDGVRRRSWLRLARWITAGLVTMLGLTLLVLA